MSECAGDNCNHPDCTHQQSLSGLSRDEMIVRAAGLSPEKWSSMNRAQRRAFLKAAKRIAG